MATRPRKKPTAEPTTAKAPQDATTETEPSLASLSDDQEAATYVEDGAHLDALRAPDFDDDQQDEEAPYVVGEDGERADFIPPEPEQMTREAFFDLFCSAFDVPGVFIPDFAPLAVQKDERPRARLASDAVYSLLQIYYPGALTPDSELVQHLLAAAPFFIGKVMVVREILRARNAQPFDSNSATRSDQAKPEPGQQPNPQTWLLPGQEQ